jgi:hypothetical protein
VAIVSLLTPPPLDDEAATAAWSFEHAMAHRTLLAAMSPLTQFSTIPYSVFMFDPMTDQGVNIPAGWWNQLHQQAHDDFTNALPSYYGATVAGIPIGQILVDADLSQAEQMTWWTFVNHQEHYIANATLIPLPPYPPYPYPYW